MAGTRRTPTGTSRGRTTGKRAPVTRRSASARARTRRRRRRRVLPSLRSLISGGLPRLPVLDQRQRDVLGLALVAAGVFMGFVLYGGWNGGRAGHGLAVALGWTLGRARVFVPVALVVGGGALLLRPVLPALRPLRAGGLCLFAAVTLALAAGMFGLSSSDAGVGTASASAWSSSYLQAHGGVAGEAQYQLAHRLVQSVGVDILVVFLLLTGVVLLSGASLASVLRATGSGVVDTTRMLRALRGHGPAMREEHGSALAGDGTGADLAAGSQLRPPEPSARELIVRATHVEAPSHDWSEDAGRHRRARASGRRRTRS